MTRPNPDDLDSLANPRSPQGCVLKANLLQIRADKLTRERIKIEQEIRELTERAERWGVIG